MPTLIHFYSRSTGVSLELPPGFESGPQDPGAQYEWRDDDDEEVLARLVVLVLAAVAPDDDDAAAVLQVAEAFLAADGELVQERTATIDDCPTATVVVHLPHGVPGSTPITGPGGDDLLVHFTAAAFDGRIRTITGFAPWSERERWTEIYDEAVASCRFL